MTDQPSDFSDDVVAAIMRHMNVDHAEDAVLICKALGNVPGTVAAQMTGMDSRGIDFMAEADGREVHVRLLWGKPLTERAQVRPEVVRMYHEACEKLGITPRGGAEH